MSPSASLWLIGSGPMAQAYAAVLQAQGVAFTVIGRSAASAEAFHQATGVPVLSPPWAWSSWRLWPSS